MPAPGQCLYATAEAIGMSSFRQERTHVPHSSTVPDSAMLTLEHPKAVQSMLGKILALASI